MENYIYKPTLGFGLEYNEQGELSRVTMFKPIDKVEWDAVRYQIPFYESELKQNDFFKSNHIWQIPHTH